MCESKESSITSTADPIRHNQSPVKLWRLTKALTLSVLSDSKKKSIFPLICRMPNSERDKSIGFPLDNQFDKLNQLILSIIKCEIKLTVTKILFSELNYVLCTIYVATYYVQRSAWKLLRSFEAIMAERVSIDFRSVGRAWFSTRAFKVSWGKCILLDLNFVEIWKRYLYVAYTKENVSSWHGSSLQPLPVTSVRAV